MMVKNYLPSFLRQKVLEWKKKAKNESDPFNKYFALYVVYNIIYGYFEKDRYYHDSTKADAVIEKIESPENFVISIKGSLERYLKLIPIFREEYWHRKVEGEKENGISYLLKKAYSEGNYKETLKQLNRWLYKVRCNLFHGGKKLEPDQEKVVLYSYRLLMSIVDEILNVS